MSAPRRCAIYTRKSSAERLDVQFSSLDNQRSYCEAYIASQAAEGWEALPEHYDDGGYSGGNLHRPSLKRLLADVEGGRIDTVVVYKIDRLTRSLKDFVGLVDRFERAGVTFVSVTQNFSTATSMGRLTLNVLLSFAQFEREMTGERLKDWFAGARARGMWTTNRPYGYAKIDGNYLTPHPVEAPIVRRIFRRYSKVGSCRIVADELFADGILNKEGRRWSTSMVLHTIKHRVYRGEMVHRRQPMPGQHEPIVSERLWQSARKTYLASTWTKRTLVKSPVPAALKGLVFDREGLRLHHTFMHAKGRLYRYYIAGAEYRRYGRGSDAYMRFRAADLERSVLDIACRLTGSNWSTRSQGEIADFLRRHIERVDIGLDDMRVTFRTGAVVSAEPGGRLGPRQARPGHSREEPPKTQARVSDAKRRPDRWAAK